MVERFVEDAVRAAIADEEGRAQVGQHVREAEQELARREAAYANLVELLTGHEDLAGTREKLAQARDVCDEARNRLEALGGDGTDAVLTVVAGRDWDRLELEERRGLIRATVARVTVAPGRETSRIGVRLFGQ